MNPALQYRQEAVRSASPIGLVVLLYETALNSIHRAIRAMEAGNIEQRVDALNHVLAVIGHLQGTLDKANGGDTARNLERFYSACRSAILDASFQQTTAPLHKIAETMQSLRDAWKEADRKSSARLVSRDNTSPVSFDRPGAWSA